MATAQSCSGCNVSCRLNNVEILTQLIEAKVDRALNQAAANRDEPRKLHNNRLVATPYTSAKKEHCVHCWFVDCSLFNSK